MCLGMSSPSMPAVQQSAPQVTPPATSPDANANGASASADQRRKAATMAGLNLQIATSPLGATTQATTSRSGQSNLLS